MKYVLNKKILTLLDCFFRLLETYGMAPLDLVLQSPHRHYISYIGYKTLLQFLSHKKKHRKVKYVTISNTVVVYINTRSKINIYITDNRPPVTDDVFLFNYIPTQTFSTV